MQRVAEKGKWRSDCSRHEVQSVSWLSIVSEGRISNHDRDRVITRRPCYAVS